MSDQTTPVDDDTAQFLHDVRTLKLHLGAHIPAGTPLTTLAAVALDLLVHCIHSSNPVVHGAMLASVRESLDNYEAHGPTGKPAPGAAPDSIAQPGVVEVPAAPDEPTLH